MGRKSHNYIGLHQGAELETPLHTLEMGFTAFKQWASDPRLRPWSPVHAPVAFDPRGRVLREAFTT